MRETWEEKGKAGRGAKKQKPAGNTSRLGTGSRVPNPRWHAGATAKLAELPAPCWHTSGDGGGGAPVGTVPRTGPRGAVVGAGPCPQPFSRPAAVSRHLQRRS